MDAGVVSDLLAAALKTDPDWTALPANGNGLEARRDDYHYSW